jgi:hypothetical protein
VDLGVVDLLEGFEGTEVIPIVTRLREHRLPVVSTLNDARDSRHGTALK